MTPQAPTFFSFLLAAAIVGSTHSLAQAQTPTPHITVTAPVGTSAQIVSVETRNVSPTEVQIGQPTIEEPAAVVVAPTPPQLAPQPTERDIHLQINLRLRLDDAPPTPNVAPAAVAPAALPIIPQGLRLQLEPPRRRYALPISLILGGSVTTILGGLSASYEEDFMWAPVLGAGLLIGGVITMIIRVSRYSRARRAYERHQGMRPQQSTPRPSVIAAPAPPMIPQPTF